jgi:hypothetical protein
MEIVKSAFEKAMEKAAGIAEFTPEEREEMKEREKIKSLLSSFYKGDLTKDGLWQRLKGSRPNLLREAQLSLADSIRLGSTPEAIQQRKEGILAIEALKDKKNLSVIEHTISSIELLQKQYHEGKERAVEELRAAMEENPQLRLRPVRTPNGKTVLQAALSVDEAVQARLSEFLAEHEERFEKAYMKAVGKLKRELK